jgi:ribonuclease HI
LKLLLYIYAAPDTPRVERNTIVVAIDGACRNNGQTNATASYGIFFAPDSPLNSNGKVPAPSSDSVHTNQKAELYALSKTLDIIEEKFGDNIQISRVVVITDSTYVVDCLAKHIWDWEYNGYKNAKGKPWLMVRCLRSYINGLRSWRVMGWMCVFGRWKGNGTLKLTD